MWVQMFGTDVLYSSASCACVSHTVSFSKSHALEGMGISVCTPSTSHAKFRIDQKSKCILRNILGLRRHLLHVQRV